MLKNIIIHPGMPKTGTSALQSRLQQNRRALAKKGVFYPVTISPLENLYWTLESHHLLFYSLAGYGESSAFSPQRFMEWVEEVCEFYDINTMILSAENIWWLPFLVFKEENLKEDEYWERKEEFFQKISCLFNKFNTQILIYLRRQDYWFESWYNQQIKNGNYAGHPGEEFFEKNLAYLDYYRNIKLWEKYFGQENISIQPYEKQRIPNGVVEDFLNKFSLGNIDEFPLRENPRVNSKLDIDTLEFLRIVNRVPMEEEDRRWFQIAVRKITQQFQKQEIFKESGLLSPEFKRKILERFFEGNQEISQEYLEENSRPLFLEEWPSSKGDWEAYQGLNVVYIVENFSKLIIEAKNSSGNFYENNQKISQDFTHDTQISKSERVLWNKYLWGGF